MYCPPPKRFSPVGEIDWVRLSKEAPSFIKPQKRTGRRALGVKYEQRGHEYFKSLYGKDYFPSQWYQFLEHGSDKPRWCQTDGLLVLPSEARVLILEFKYQHTSDAWWQLRKLYQPVIEELVRKKGWRVQVCEVVKWYDPATKFPEKIRLVPAVTELNAGEFGIHIWKP